MKKVWAAVLTAAFMLLLVACSGGGEDFKSSFDVENAIAETPKHILWDVADNQARAMQNTYLIDCIVGDIADTYFSLDNYNIRICLATEELAELSRNDNVAIIGKITEASTINGRYGKETNYIMFGEAEIYDGEIPEVAPREEEIFSGKLRGENDSYKGAWNIEINSSPFLKLIYFSEGEDLSLFNEKYDSIGTDGTEIVFSADVTGDPADPDSYCNAKIIEIVEE